MAIRVQTDFLVSHLEADIKREAFLAASRGGDLNALVALLDPDVVLRADSAAVRAGASTEVRHSAGSPHGSHGSVHERRLCDPGTPLEGVGHRWRTAPRVVFDGFTITRGKIVAIDLLADPERLRQLDVVVHDD